MDLNFEISTEMMTRIGEVLMNHLFNLFVSLSLGLLIGVLITAGLFLLMRKTGWFNRKYQSGYTRMAVSMLQFLFYVSIIGLSATISLHIGSEKIG